MSLPCSPCSSRPRSAQFALFLGCLFSTLFVSFSFAQADGKGTIIGKILNPANGEYLRNATVRVQETGQETVAEDGGVYRLAGVNAGTATVEVNYTGFRPAITTVQVEPGVTSTVNFDLVSSLQSVTAVDGKTIELDRFVVVSDSREGSAKAIMDQRRSMNITNSVASDSFGDVAEGNVGEFLKHMPGVMLNLVEGEARTVSLRGLGAEYTAVTLDGVSLASADANSGAAGDARAFSFEQVSLNSMESIEVSKTISADSDANAPAGTINLKPKRAFDRKGRRISWQLNATAFNRELTFDRTPGPDDNPSRKIRGGGMFEFSDVFFKDRFGVVLNVSESNVYSEIAHTTMTYNQTPTQADPRTVVPTQISTFHGPRTNRRFTITLNTDLKITDNLTFSLGYLHNESDLWFFYRNAVFNTGARTSVLGTDPLLSFTSTAAGTAVVNPIAVAKTGKADTFTPKFEYRRENLVIEGRFAASDSESTYLPAERGAVRTLGSPTINGITFQADRSSVLTGDWKIRQVAGPDMSNGANFTSPALETIDGRFNRVQLFSGDVTAALTTNILGVPVVWKVGLKRVHDIRDYDITREGALYTYTGPGAGLGAWANYRSPNPFDFGSVGASATSISGAPIFYPHLLQTSALYFDHPEYFTRTMTATNFYNSRIANKKHYVEEIDSAFAMGTARIGKATARAGLRWEQTTGDAREFDPLTASQVAAAGYAVAGSRATTIQGLEYQYFTQPMINRVGSYDNFFPSGSLKYAVSRNLDIHFGYSSTIRRPTFRDITGVFDINEETQRISAPNVNLKPETSDNYSLRAAYYFEPVGLFAVNFFQNNVQHLFQSTTIEPDQFDYDGPLDLTGYLITTTIQSENDVIVRGMELEYSQSLSFLPGYWKGLNVRASYTRNYASTLMTNMSPHALTAGIGYSLYRASLYANLNWSDDRPTNVAGTQYVRRRYNVDMGGTFKITDRVSVFLNVRNILNEPYLSMQTLNNGVSAVRKYEMFGTNYTLGVRGTF